MMQSLLGAGCKHGFVRPSPQMGMVIMGFMATVFGAMQSAVQNQHDNVSMNDLADVMIQSYNMHSEIWKKEASRKSVMEACLGIGTEHIINPNGYKETVPMIAFMVLMFEKYGEMFGRRPQTQPVTERELSDMIASTEFGQKYRDLLQGDERSAVKFFRKRITCKCLDGKMKEVKYDLEKSGLCDNCQERFDRDKLKNCSACKIARYCSRKCQVDAWPIHKPMCKVIAKGAKISPILITGPRTEPLCDGSMFDYEQLKKKWTQNGVDGGRDGVAQLLVARLEMVLRGACCRLDIEFVNRIIQKLGGSLYPTDEYKEICGLDQKKLVQYYYNFEWLRDFIKEKLQVFQPRDDQMLLHWLCDGARFSRGESVDDLFANPSITAEEQIKFLPNQL